MNDFFKKVKEYFEDVPVIGALFDPKPKIVVVRMSGIIASSASFKKSGISHEKYKKLFEKVFDMKPLKAVVLVINSPGGAPVQCSLITNQIKKLSNQKEVPIYTFVEDVAASGGYWLACAGEEIYVQESSIVGSIGVISASFGFEDFIEKHQIKRRVYTAGDNKSFLDPFMPEQEKDVKQLKAIQGDIYSNFKNWVKTSRGERLNGSDKVLMNGDFWAGNEAVKKGLVDGIGDVQTIMEEKFGVDIRFVEKSPEKGFLPSLMSSRRDASSDVINTIIETAETRAFWSRFGL